MGFDVVHGGNVPSIDVGRLCSLCSKVHRLNKTPLWDKTLEILTGDTRSQL
ncbi:hypothetical protein MKX03_028913, partial [Papaver bracteatum]